MLEINSLKFEKFVVDTGVTREFGVKLEELKDGDERELQSMAEGIDLGKDAESKRTIQKMFVSGMSYDEIAKILGLELSLVEKYLD